MDVFKCFVVLKVFLHRLPEKVSGPHFGKIYFYGGLKLERRKHILQLRTEGESLIHKKQETLLYVQARDTINTKI